MYLKAIKGRSKVYLVLRISTKYMGRLQRPIMNVERFRRTLHGTASATTEKSLGLASAGTVVMDHASMVAAQQVLVIPGHYPQAVVLAIPLAILSPDPCLSPISSPQHNHPCLWISLCLDGSVDLTVMVS